MLTALFTTSLWGRPISRLSSKSSQEEEEEEEKEDTMWGACTATASALGSSRGTGCAAGFSPVSGRSLAALCEVPVRGHQVELIEGQQQR